VNNEKIYGRYRVIFGDILVFRCQLNRTIEGSRKFQSLPLFGWKKIMILILKIYLDIFTLFTKYVTACSFENCKRKHPQIRVGPAAIK
jgi:hypothetical protein